MKQSFTIKDLPVPERPRERMVVLGERALSIQELIAIVLGKGIRGESVLTTAQNLLSQFGSLNGLCEASFEDLQSVRGLGFAKACQVKACLEIARRISLNEQVLIKDASRRVSIISPEILAPLLRDRVGDFKKEHCVVASFDIRNKLIGIDTVGVGILNANLIHPREVFSTAISRHAAAIIISHNHPSGESEPSDEDVLVTERLVSSGRVVGIEVMDHVIVTKSDFYSFKEHGLL